MIPEGIKELPSGVWVVENDTHYHGWIAKHGLQCDPHLFQWLKPVLERPGIDVVWDIGACVGDHTDFYLSLGKRVLAVEPNPIAFKCLEHNCPKAKLLNVAASDTKGELRFTCLENLGASRVLQDGEIAVPSVRLDEVDAYDRVDFVKLDSEGYEPFVLRGMEKIIQKFKPLVFTEVNRGALALNGFSVESFKSLVEAFGYVAKSLYPEKARWEDEQFDVLFVPQ